MSKEIQAGMDFYHHYTLGKQLALGGQAEVWKAERQTDGQPVAIKIALPFEASSQQQLQSQAQLEIDILSQLDHPHIINLEASGEIGGRPFLVMPYIEDGSLQQLLDQKRKITPGQALPFIWQIADALQYTHGRGVVHNDVKPANILLQNKAVDNPFTLLTDFGAATIINTPQKRALGTTAFVSPQRILLEEPHPQDDLYALGCVAFQLITGQYLYNFEHITDETAKYHRYLQAHLYDQPILPENAKSPAVEAVWIPVSKALSKERSQRQASTWEFAWEFAQAYSAVPEPQTTVRKKIFPTLQAIEQIPLPDPPESNHQPPTYDLLFDPHQSRELSHQALRLASQRRHQEALLLYQKALALDASNSNTYYNMSISLGSLQKYDQALQACDQAIALDAQQRKNSFFSFPHHSYAFYGKGLALSHLGQPSEAITAYLQSLQFAKHSNTYYYLAQSLNEIGLHDDAWRSYNESVIHYRENPLPNSIITPQDVQRQTQTLLRMGDNFARQKKYDLALESLSFASRLDPQNADIHYQLSTILLQKAQKLENTTAKKDYQKARQSCQKAIRLGKQDSLTYTVLGDIAKGLGQSKRALKAYYTALELSDNDTSSAQNHQLNQSIDEMLQKLQQQRSPALIKGIIWEHVPVFIKNAINF